MWPLRSRGGDNLNATKKGTFLRLPLVLWDVHVKRRHECHVSLYNEASCFCFVSALFPSSRSRCRAPSRDRRNKFKSCIEVSENYRFTSGPKNIDSGPLRREYIDIFHIILYFPVLMYILNRNILTVTHFCPVLF